MVMRFSLTKKGLAVNRRMQWRKTCPVRLPKKERPLRSSHSLHHGSRKKQLLMKAHPLQLPSHDFFLHKEYFPVLQIFTKGNKMNSITRKGVRYAAVDKVERA